MDLGERKYGKDNLNHFVPGYEVAEALDRVNGMKEDEKALNQAKHQAKAVYVTLKKACFWRDLLIQCIFQKAADEDIKKAQEGQGVP